MAARKEIRTGARVGLSWSLQQMRKPPSFRNVVDHRIGTIEGGVMDVLLPSLSRWFLDTWKVLIWIG